MYIFITFYPHTAGLKPQMITLNTPCQFTPALPQKTTVVIIGAGVIGVTTALSLAERGIPVLLCEKGRVAGEQSSRNWGWVRQQGRDADELPLMQEANGLWQNMATRIGEDVGFRQEGVLYLASSEAEMARFDTFYQVAQQAGLDTCYLSQKEIDQRIDTHPGQWHGGMLTASDGRAEPWLAVPAMARAAQRAGAIIKEDCAVRALDIQGGQVAGVVTEHGRVACSQVVLAGGAWSSLFLRNLGINLPQLTVRASVAKTSPAPLLFAGNAADEKLAFRRREDGGYTLALCDFHEHYVGPDSFRHSLPFLPAARAAWHETHLLPAAPSGYPDAWRTARQWSEEQTSPFENLRVLDPQPKQTTIDRIQQRLKAKLPKLSDVAITHSWAGMIDTTPDFVPVIDHAPSLPGLTIATGFSGHGFGIGPAVGRILTALLQGEDAGHDLSRFSFARFSAGEALKLGPTL